MRRLFLLLLALSVGTAGWLFREDLRAAWMWYGAWRAGKSNAEATESRDPRPDRETYDAMKRDLERWRLALQTRHKSARNPEERRAVERDARALLETVLPEMMRCWLGTPWDFNGTASGPGPEPVACGYFVSTVLLDAGFRLDRYRLAQQPSSRILTSLIPRETCRLLVDLPYERFVNEVEGMPSGVYLLGLDTHVAFLVVREGDFRFIHSSGSEPWRVVDEACAEAKVLRESRWRMLGNLTADEALLRKWLAKEEIRVRTS